MSQALDLLVLRLTGRCNLNCAYCYAEGAPGGADLPEELALRAVELACRPGESLRVQFTGGEPLLRWETAVRILEYGARTGRKLSASLQTNGTLITPELCRDLNRFSVGVGVSLDGMGAEGNATRPMADGSSSFHAVIRGLQTLAEAGLGANLMAVVTARNVERLPQLLDLALWLGNVHGLGLDLIREQGRGAGGGLSPGADALNAGLDGLFARHDLLERLGRPVRLKELERMRLLLRTGQRRTCYCNAQTGRSLAVAADGSLWPCSSLVGAEGCRMGHLDQAEELPRTLCPGVGPAGVCAACPAFGFCGGGCPAGRLGREAPAPLDCLLHRRFFRHACQLEGRTDLCETAVGTFPDRL